MAAFDYISASNELISGPVNPIRLDIASPSWSPDGTKVAYTVIDDTMNTANQVIGLNYHDTNIGNRHSIRLSSPADFPSYQDIPDFTWSADSLHMAYRSDDIANGFYRVFKIDFAASSLLPTSSSLPINYAAQAYAFSADSQYLATVLRKQSGTTIYQLFTSVSGAGADVFKAESIQNPMSINWANQSPLLAFSATDQSGVGHLYQLNMNNGISTLLSTGTQPGERVENFDWSPTIITWVTPVHRVCIW